MRSLADADGNAVITYDDLAFHLSSIPGSPKAAAETVARVLKCLRLTAWITLAEYCRDPATGCLKASRYVVRDQPLPLTDACLADMEYLPLVESAVEHANAALRWVARDVLGAVRHVEDLIRLPESMRVRIRRLRQGEDQGMSLGGDVPDDGGNSGDVADAAENTTVATHVADISGVQWTIPCDPKPVQGSGHTVQVQKPCIKEVPVQNVAVLENSSPA
jgi:hypothetical protein